MQPPAPFDARPRHREKSSSVAKWQVLDTGFSQKGNRRIGREAIIAFSVRLPRHTHYSAGDDEAAPFTASRPELTYRSDSKGRNTRWQIIRSGQAFHDAPASSGKRSGNAAALLPSAWPSPHSVE
ncbi:MAG: hypothetical protein QNI93_21075 [Kiloniellales bacterium]|nr:hypothetical protein [Kiloniellales bacterium]